MNDAPRRPLDELPGDPRGLQLEYHLSESVGWVVYEGGIDEWTVSVRHERSGWRKSKDTIGSMTLYRFRLDDRLSAFQEAETEDIALSNLVLGVYDLGNGGYRQAFREAVRFPDQDLLVLYDVRLDKEWRGFGLGPILASQAVWMLADGCSAVTVATHVTELQGAGRSPGEEEWKLANEKITALWESIGFRQYVRPLGHLLDPATAEAKEYRDRRGRDFRALTEAYAAAHRR